MLYIAFDKGHKKLSQYPITRAILKEVNFTKIATRRREIEGATKDDIDTLCEVDITPEHLWEIRHETSCKTIVIVDSKKRFYYLLCELTDPVIEDAKVIELNPEDDE